MRNSGSISMSRLEVSFRSNASIFCINGPLVISIDVTNADFELSRSRHMSLRSVTCKIRPLPEHPNR
jgi:hypothetical protein